MARQRHRVNTDWRDLRRPARWPVASRQPARQACRGAPPGSGNTRSLPACPCRGNDDAGHGRVLAQASTRAASARQTSCVMFWLPTLATCSARMRAMPASCGTAANRSSTEKEPALAGRGRVGLGAGDGAAGRQHRHHGQRVRHRPLRTGPGVQARNSGVPSRGSRSRSGLVLSADLEARRACPDDRTRLPPGASGRATRHWPSCAAPMPTRHPWRSWRPASRPRAPTGGGR